MPVVCKELVGIELRSNAQQPGGSSRYIVIGASTPAEANEAVALTAPTTAALTVPVGSTYASGFVTRLDIDLTELGAGVYSAVVNYGIREVASEPIDIPPIPGSPPPPPPPSQQPDTNTLGPEFEFDTTGGTSHLTQSFNTRQRVTATGYAAAPDVNRAIGVSNTGVSGVDVVSRRLEWTISVSKSNPTQEYIRTLYKLAGTINLTTFFGYEPECLLFLGASGRYKAGEGWRINYRFAGGFKKENFEIASGIMFDVLYPHDYVWVSYDSKVVNGFLMQVPKWAYAERVYPYGDFRELKI